MARPLKWWIAAALLACAVVGFAYLPPRSTPVLSRGRFQTLEPPTPYRLRVQELAERWRATALELQLLEYRQRLQPELARRRALEIPGPALLIVGSDTLSDSARTLVRTLLDSAWSRLGLGVSKVSVGLVLSVEFGAPKSPGTIPNRPWAPVYLLADTTDRTTCIAFLPITYWGRSGALKEPHPSSNAALVSSFRSALGPCAFYAAFGAPGRPVARWLGSYKFELATDAWGADETPISPQIAVRLDERDPWFWMQVYRFAPAAVACIAGRLDACRRAVLDGGAGDSVPRIVMTQRVWWEPATLAGADRYLADVVRHAGRERFGRFWNSELPVDTALASALRMPVGEWTRRWQATIVLPIRLGAAAPLGATVLALFLGFAAVATVTLTVSRREVR